jgi:hypothetical protein
MYRLHMATSNPSTGTPLPGPFRVELPKAPPYNPRIDNPGLSGSAQEKQDVEDMRKRLRNSK